MLDLGHVSVGQTSLYWHSAHKYVMIIPNPSMFEFGKHFTNGCILAVDFYANTGGAIYGVGCASGHESHGGKCVQIQFDSLMNSEQVIPTITKLNL